MIGASASIGILGKTGVYPKRLFDFTIALLAGVLLAPLIAVVALAVRLKLGSPVLFIQARPGLHAKPFDLVKFRTMLDSRNGRGELLSDAERLTPFGRFLRSTSLDELPELWNVLKGEMSLVGPRPLLLQYLDLYTPHQARRHEVRPGITGWAQVNGRNAATWPERFAMDVWYVDNVSFRTDLRILWMTVVEVLSRRGVSAEGEATVRYYTGETDEADSPERPDQASGGRSGTEA